MAKQSMLSTDVKDGQADNTLATNGNDQNLARIRCLHEGCASALLTIKSLANHLDRVHKVAKTPYACDVCMFEGPKVQVENHMALWHSIRKRASPLLWALARFYERKCEKNTTIIPKSDTRPHQAASTAIEIIKGEKEGQDSIDPIMQSQAAGATALAPSNRNCNVCHESLEAKNRREIIQHQYQKHGIVIDFDRCAVRPEPEEPAFRIGPKPAMLGMDTDYHDSPIEGSASDLLNVRDDVAEFGGEDGATCDTNISADCEDAEEVSPEPGAQDTVAQPRDAKHIRKILMKCMNKASLPLVEQILEQFETRLVANRERRVHKGLQNDVNWESCTVIYAIPEFGGWHCQVPSCGAITSELFVMDLHLHTHGSKVVNTWYCGDMTCSVGSERVFEDKQSFELHVVKEHFASKLSAAAGRQVSQEDGLIVLLVDCLNIPKMDDRQYRISGRDLRSRAPSEKRCIESRPTSDVQPSKRRRCKLKLGEEKSETVKHQNHHDGAKTPSTAHCNFQRLFCPWPDCEYTNKKKRNIALHLLTSHLMYVWQCAEPGCEYCGYHDSTLLQRHRMLCHIGSPLQCGHEKCAVTLSKRDNSRGYIKSSDLRCHFEKMLNGEIPEYRTRSSIYDLDQGDFSSVQVSQDPLPNDVEYRDRFENQSGTFFSKAQKDFRLKQNREMLSRQGVSIENVTVKGSQRCTGFWIQERYFTCIDNVLLTCETAILVFKDAEVLFTVVPTCDFCIHIMSAISRPFAPIPLPFHFAGTSKTKQGRIRQAGRGKDINSVASFWKYAWRNFPQFPPMAQKYLHVRKMAPEKIFIVDFEFVLQDAKGLPLIPIEVTVRAWDHQIIVSCVINEEGMTNQMFHEYLQEKGFTANRTFAGVNKIRGSRHLLFPPRNTMTTKEIVRTLRNRGLDRNAFWVEWSNGCCDRKCMEVLIKAAGEDVSAMLPPADNTWTVFGDFTRWLPGLASYKLGDIVALMDAKHKALKRLHYSDADTSALHFLLETWLQTRSTEQLP